MTPPSDAEPAVRTYCVDEAGDGTLFDRKGRVVVGNEGCSRFFMLGFADVGDPDGLGVRLSELRQLLLGDPYFKNVPSMQVQAGKTATHFHAKDDLPEVRREVYRLLLDEELRFFAVVKSKRRLLDYVRQRNLADPDYRYHPNELYDHLVRRLFKEHLHKAERCQVYFAKRGKSDRTRALRAALQSTHARFCRQHGVPPGSTLVSVEACRPRDCAGLQAADYLLWALQRLYERGEDRFVELMWAKFRLVHDVDDTRERQYGVYYTQRKPLNRAALEGLPGI